MRVGIQSLLIVFNYPCQFMGVPMIVNLGSRDADVVQPFRAVARECVKMTTFIIMVACLGFAAAAQVGPDRRGGESADTSAWKRLLAALPAASARRRSSR
jgi:hypothetical protein